MGMKILVVGKGGRECAIVRKLAESLRVQRVFAAPGNPGMVPWAENVAIDPFDFDTLARFAENTGSYTLVGPEGPLAAGIVDFFRSRSLPIFGPTRDAAKIESSKIFAKKLMRRMGVLTSNFCVFPNPDSACAHMLLYGLPRVIKADGLAAGRGVIECRTKDEVARAFERMKSDSVFCSSQGILVEEFLEGREASMHAITDEVTVEVFPFFARDEKKRGPGKGSPNTGGMGVYAPAWETTCDQQYFLKRNVVEAILDGMRKTGSPFTGCLYPGLILTDKGVRALEYNARFGDPETQAYLLLLESDLAEIIVNTIEGTLDRVVPFRWRRGYAVCVVLAAERYPDVPSKDAPISGIREAEALSPNIAVYHAGTTWTKDYKLVTNGGRILNVVAYGETLEEARALTYEAVKYIQFEGKYYRDDIAKQTGQ